MAGPPSDEPDMRSEGIAGNGWTFTGATMEQGSRVKTTDDLATTLSASLSAPSVSTPPSAVRGRPRSASISHGSPNPPKGSLPLIPGTVLGAPLPTWTFKSPSSPPPNANGLNLMDEVAASSPTTSRHRTSLSVPGLSIPAATDIPGAATPGDAPARRGRHRRTQSVSPPGLPVLSATSSSGFADPVPSTSQVPKPSFADSWAFPEAGPSPLPPVQPVALSRKLDGPSGLGALIGGARRGSADGLPTLSAVRKASWEALVSNSRPSSESAVSTSPTKRRESTERMLQQGAATLAARRGSHELPKAISIVAPGFARQRTPSAPSTQVFNALPGKQNGSPIIKPFAGPRSLSKSPSTVISGSPTSGGMVPATSHAALLSGIRSHALPASPVLDCTKDDGVPDFGGYSMIEPAAGIPAHASTTPVSHSPLVDSAWTDGGLSDDDGWTGVNPFAVDGDDPLEEHVVPPRPQHEGPRSYSPPLTPIPLANMGLAPAPPTATGGGNAVSPPLFPLHLEDDPPPGARVSPQSPARVVPVECEAQDHASSASALFGPPVGSVPPPSPHRSPISLPLPPIAPSSLPAHLVGGVIHQRRTPSPPRSPPRSPPKRRQSKSPSRRSPVMGKDHAPRVPSPLASPAVTQEPTSTPLDHAMEEEEPLFRPSREEKRSSPMIRETSKSPTLGFGGQMQFLPLQSPPSPKEQTEEAPFEAFGLMDIDKPTALGLQSAHDDEPGQDDEGMRIDDESLSALERIFLCAKSGGIEDRARVAWNLPNWLGSVDICEAVEYVLPLLGDLAVDSDSAVKECLVPRLDEILWHFYSQCPIVEAQHHVNHERFDMSSTPNFSTINVAEFERSETSEASPTSTHFLSSEGTSSTPPPASTTKTSPATIDVVEAPCISATSFTSLLGALLTDQSSFVAEETQSAFVRFLCKLKRRPEPPAENLDALEHLKEEYDDPITGPSLEAPHRHYGYELDDGARAALEQEFVSGIVVGLARLDEDSTATTRDAPVASGPEKSPASENAMTPTTEENDDVEDQWLTSALRSESAQEGQAVEWGEGLRSFFNDGLTSPMAFDESVPTSGLNSGEIPGQQAFSLATQSGPDEEEASIGKLVSMSLIRAVAKADCLDTYAYEALFLPEVDKMKDEPMFYVRKQAVLALESLSKVLPIEVLESRVASIQDVFAGDTLWHVRRAACIALPSVLRRMPLPVRVLLASKHMQSFSTDTSKNVRSSALEICGELIHLFHGHPFDVPESILKFYLGTVDSAPSSPKDKDLKELRNMDNSPPESFFDTSSSWPPVLTSFSSRAATDLDRPIVSAFNLPAVALTLGPERWEALSGFHRTLCQDSIIQVRRSLASSMHELAKILSPTPAARGQGLVHDLVDPFTWFLRDGDDVRNSMLENIGALLLHVGYQSRDCLLQLLRELGAAWPEFRAWRVRELVLQQVGTALEPEHGLWEDGDDVREELLALTGRGLRDGIAAVRHAAVKLVPALLDCASRHAESDRSILAFLGVFATDSSYRLRSTFIECLEAVVKSSAGRGGAQGGGEERAVFELRFGGLVGQLAKDRVVGVRIGVAGLVAVLCQPDSLYPNPAHRQPGLQEIIDLLASSADGDVRALVWPFLLSPDAVAPPIRAVSIQATAPPTPIPSASSSQILLPPRDPSDSNSNGSTTSSTTTAEDEELMLWDSSSPPLGSLSADMLGEGEGTEDLGLTRVVSRAASAGHGVQGSPSEEYVEISSVGEEELG